MCPIIALWGGTRNLENVLFFSAETTIHNSQYNMCSIKLWAKDYPHAGHLGLLVVIESSIASLKHATASMH